MICLLNNKMKHFLNSIFPIILFAGILPLFTFSNGLIFDLLFNILKTDSQLFLAFEKSLYHVIHLIIYISSLNKY